MATIGGLTSTTSNNIRGYGGLASGMDRDTLIEGMTYGTTSKITQQEQKKQQLEWKQEAVRAISDMMIAFANRYTDSLTSSNNLFSSMFWGRNNITTTGTNSKYVSVTGTASAADAITIMGVKQMAQDAKWTSSESVSDMKLQTGTVGKTLDSEKGMSGNKYVVQHLDGKTIDFQYGDSSYSVTLGIAESDTTIYDYRSPEKIAASINKQLEKVSVNDDKNLSELVEFHASADGKIIVTGKSGGNTLKMTGGSALELLGYKMKDDNDKAKEWNLTNDISTTGAKGDEKVDPSKIQGEETFAHKVSGKELIFSYNGTTKTIKMPTLGEGVDDLKDDNTLAQNLSVIETQLQTELDKAFGSGRIKVDTEGGKLGFTTYNPATGDKDSTSTFTLVSGDSNLVGPNGVLGIKAGISNRVNLNASLKDAGLGLKDEDFDGTKNKITITGLDEPITLTADMTVNDLIEKINKESGITVSYQTVGDKFTFTSKEKGASGKIEIGGDSDFLNKLFGVKKGETIEAEGQDAIVAVKYKGSDDVVELIRDTNSFTVDGLSVGVKGTFGYKDVEQTTEVQALAGKTLKFTIDGIDEPVDLELADGYSYKSVEDIVKSIQDQLEKKEVGAGKKLSDFVKIEENSWLGSSIVINSQNGEKIGLTGGTALELLGVSISNEIPTNGLTGVIDENKLVELEKTTVKEYDNSTEEVNINAQVDTDKIVDNIKSMIDEYNKIIELVNKELTTKPDRDYAPLTSEQKKELSESEIETWETKAKSGLLYGDSDLRSLSSDLRFIMSGGTMEEFRKIGITTSTLYSENGKLSLDESKLRAALETNPESVEKLFTEPVGKDEKGNDITGMATKLKSVMDKYVKTLGSMDSKGILIKKAGSKSSAMSLTENAMYKQLAEINKQISKLQTRLETERDRYIKQFTSLETLISQMNSQSSWLSQLGGY